MRTEEGSRSHGVLDYRSTEKQRRWSWLVVVLMLALLIPTAFWAVGKLSRGALPIPMTPDWYAGKKERSPDGLFYAEGLVYHDKGRSWCTMEVVEIATKKRVFYREQTIGATDRQPMFDQGNSADDGIEWAADSSSITFEGKNRERFVVPVR